VDRGALGSCGSGRGPSRARRSPGRRGRVGIAREMRSTSAGS
jgi:hypothetical protein